MRDDQDPKEQPNVVLPRFKVTGTATNTPPKTDEEEND